MKVTLVAAILLTGTCMADAKGGKQVFNAPAPYDYSRETKPGFKKDYCEDSVGNHIYCQTGSKSSSYTSRYPAN